MIFRYVLASLSVGPSIGPLVMLLSRLVKNGFLRIVNERGRINEVGARQQEQQGGRSDEVEGAARRRE